ncbi:hypothetical protein PSAC2689_110208 [Paraburkholderia sacchari]
MCFMTFLCDIQTELKWPGYWNHSVNPGAKFKCACPGNGAPSRWNSQLRNMEISEFPCLKLCAKRKIC